MRKIKFRAWYKYGKKMVDLYKITPLAVADHNGTMDGLFLPFDNNMILMQYTGLLDKNGKEIYEGDRVLQTADRGTEQYPDYTVIEHVVEFRGGAFYPVCDEPDKNFEVIGNIYEKI